MASPGMQMEERADVIYLESEMLLDFFPPATSQHEWAGRWAENWLISSAESGWKPCWQCWVQVHSVSSSATSMRAVPTLTKYTNDTYHTYLGRAADAPEGCAAIPQDLDKLQSYTPRKE